MLDNMCEIFSRDNSILVRRLLAYDNKYYDLYDYSFGLSKMLIISSMISSHDA